MPSTGELRDLIEVQEEIRTPNGQGGYSTSWSKLAGPAGNTRANMFPLTGDEALQVGVQRSVQQWRVTTRRRPDITPKHRLKWGSIILDIKSAVPHPEDPRLWTLMICESGLVT